MSNKHVGHGFGHPPVGSGGTGGGGNDGPGGSSGGGDGGGKEFRYGYKQTGRTPDGEAFESKINSSWCNDGDYGGSTAKASATHAFTSRSLHIEGVLVGKTTSVFDVAGHNIEKTSHKPAKEGYFTAVFNRLYGKRY